MTKITQIIKQENYCVDKNVTISKAIEMMAKNKDGFVVFTDNQKVIGVLTERDLVSYILNDNDYNQNAFQYAFKNVITFRENRTIEYILMSLIEFGIRRVIIIDKDENFLGVTTQEHLIEYIDNEAYKVKMELSNLDNLHSIISLDETTSITNTIQCMKDNHIGSVVLTNNQQPVGILTERDIVKLINNNLDLSQAVSTVMSKPLIYIDVNNTVEDALSIMNNKHIQRIIVKDCYGYKILSIRDIVHLIKGNYGILVEKKLQHSKAILNSISEAILEVGQIEDEYIIQWCNEEAFKLFGYTILDKNITKVLPDHTWDSIIKSNYSKLTKFNSKIYLNQKYYKLTCMSDLSEQDSKYRLIFFDITELEELNMNLQKKVEDKTKALQEINNTLELNIKKAVEENKNILDKMYKTEKMAALGEMMGNIAHQWRQPLSVISSNATGIIIQKEYNTLTDSFLLQSCETINSNAQYLSQTIDDFRNFVKPEAEKQLFSLTTLFDGFFRLQESVIKNKEITVIFDIDDTLELLGYKNELIQAIINIFNNAKDVFEEKNQSLKLILISAYKDKENIIITIKDNAGGIPTKVLPRIFEPYFTTKHQAQGTGLGLHMTYNLIKHMNGHIEASNTQYNYENKNYKGALFKLIF